MAQASSVSVTTRLAAIPSVHRREPHLLHNNTEYQTRLKFLIFSPCTSVKYLHYQVHTVCTEEACRFVLGTPEQNGPLYSIDVFDSSMGAGQGRNALT